MNTTETVFVGDSRKPIVSSLYNVFRDCVLTTTPRWVSLEGPTGCGKSRVVREFYRVLAEAQTTPTYWPESLIDSNDPAGRDVHARRKRVVPFWSGSPGAAPDYMWWGIDCGELNGVPSERLAIALKQFIEHAESLDKAYAESAIHPLRLQNFLRNAASAIREEAIGELITAGIQKGVEVITRGAIEELPGTELVIRTGQWAWNKRKVAKARDNVVAAGKPIEGIVSQDPIDEAFETLRRLTYRGILPTIVFVEDLHDADEALVELLQRVLRSSGNAVMVITTTWTGELDKRESLEPMRRLFGKQLILGDRYHRLAESGRDSADSPLQGSFTELDIDSKLQIVRDYVPGIDESTARKLAMRYQQPLLLELVLCASWLHEDYGERLERLDESAIESLPSTIDQYYQNAWERLPESARETLIYAAIGVPYLIDPETSRRGLEWSLVLLTDALDAAKISHRCLPRLDSEPRILGWCEPADDRLSRFREWQHLDQATNSTTLTDDRRYRILTSLAGQAGEALREDVGGYGNGGYLENLVLALAFARRVGNRPLVNPLLEDRTTIADAAERRMIALLGFPRELEEIIRLGKIVLDHVDDSNSERALFVRGWIAYWTAERGAVEEALALSKALLVDRERVLGPDHLDTLGLRGNIADCAAKNGDIKSALELCVDLLNDQKRVLGPDHLATLRTRNSIAGWTAESGVIKEALRLFNALLVDWMRVLGPDHPGTLNTRYNIASWTSADGEIEDGLLLSESVLVDRMRVLGPDHPDTLITRYNIAYWTAVYGDINKALELSMKLLDDQERVLGPDHLLTLLTRHNIAGWTAVHG